MSKHKNKDTKPKEEVKEEIKTPSAETPATEAEVKTDIPTQGFHSKYWVEDIDAELSSLDLEGHHNKASIDLAVVSAKEALAKISASLVFIDKALNEKKK